jgi:hypothetical protein
LKIGLKKICLKKYEIWVKNRNDISSDENVSYEEIYYKLEQQYKEKTGSFYMIKRINMYILSKDKANIMIEKNINNVSLSELAKRYEVTESTMKKFISL